MTPGLVIEWSFAIVVALVALATVGYALIMVGALVYSRLAAPRIRTMPSLTTRPAPVWTATYGPCAVCAIRDGRVELQDGDTASGQRQSVDRSDM